MERREFFRNTLAAGSAATFPWGRGAKGMTKYHLRYAPRLGFLQKELTIPQRLELFAEHGFDAIEYNGLMKHSLSEVESMRKKMEALGIEMGIFVANPTGSTGFRGGPGTAGMVDPSQRNDFLDSIKKAIKYHEVIGNHYCTVITSVAIPGIPRGTQRINVIEALRRAAEIVEKYELTLVVEPLNEWVDHAGYFLVRSDEAAEIMASVNSPKIKILFDIYHQQISEGNLINNIRNHYEYIGYFQVGDVPGRKEPGTGEVNWRNVFKSIHDLGYKGILGMEHGLSVEGIAGLEKCFNEYRKADAW